MENEITYATDVLCHTFNTIFSNIFSSIDTTINHILDNLLFIHSDITDTFKFQQLFGTDSTNGLLLIANSLLLGIILFYIFHFALSHLIYLKIDSPYQFIFKCIIFIACTNSSLWLCEKLIYFISLVSDSICEVGSLIHGCEISFSHLTDTINSSLYVGTETFELFSFDGILKLISTLGTLYILFLYSIRYVLCKIFILLAPFAFISLVNNRSDGFFKGWLKYFLILLFMQVFVAIVLIVGFSFEYYAGDTLSKLMYCAIILIIAKSHVHVKEIFSFIGNYSHNTLKKFI